jgi:NAD(P)-dependent dehydrogenase (short-subunit alcohol dehydrogenase family)
MDEVPELPNMPSTSLAGRHALVTGGSRGIGLAAAAALGRAGARVTLVARGAPGLEAAVEALRADGIEASGIEVDVTDIAAFSAAVGRIQAPDVLVNNAGTNRPRPFLEVTVEDFDAIMSLNLRAAFFSAQAVARAMVAQGTAGSIINVCSQMGHVGGKDRTVYCASKWGLEGLTRSMAVDLAGTGIRANTVCPTFIETPLTKPFFDDVAFREDVLSRIKLGRLGELEDLMGAFVFLAGDASKLMTGASMLLDGGWTAD